MFTKKNYATTYGGEVHPRAEGPALGYSGRVPRSDEAVTEHQESTCPPHP